MPYRDDSPAPRCALCETLLEPAEAERFATLALCRPCFEGDFGERLAQRGIRVQQLGLRTRMQTENRHLSTYTLVRAAVDRDLTLQARFSREDFISRIGKLFRPELKIGDPLFDDDVFIRTDDPEALGRLLRSESLQSLIHTAVSELAEHELPLVIEGARVKLLSEESPSASGADYLRRVAALLACHLARDAGGPPATPGPLFDLAEINDLLISGQDLIGLYLRYDRLDDLQRLVRLKREEGHDRLEHLGLNDLRLPSSDLSPLAAIPELQTLSLARDPDVVDVSGLADALALRRLDLYECPVADVSALAGLGRLEELNLNWTRVRDLWPLARLGQLKRLFVQHSGVTELSALAGLTDLEWLNVRDTAVEDLGPIMGHRNLKRLDVKRSRVPAEQLERLTAAIPGLQIDPH